MIKGLKIVSALLVCAALPVLTGCSACKTRSACAKTITHTKLTAHSTAVADLPPNAVPGECYAKVYVPPKFETASQRVCVKEASERVEIVPAEYEWIEERVCVKQASTQYIEEPAVYEDVQETLVLEPGHTDWVREDGSKCKSPSGQVVGDVFCLVSFPPVEKTVTTQRMVKSATCREVTIPAEYQMVRVQKLVKPACTQRIAIAAVFEDVQKTVKVADGFMEWQRVICERQTSTDKINELKTALTDLGYTPGPANGELTDEDWAAIKKYQADHRLGVGQLTYQTLDKLGVSMP